MAINGLPVTGKTKIGYFCKCNKHWAIGDTKAIAFAEWKKLADESPKVRERREFELRKQGGIGGQKEYAY